MGCRVNFGPNRLRRGWSLAAGGAAAWFLWRAWLDSSRRISLRNRVVVITGGSRGLGLSMAREFGRRGARVAICARTERQVVAAGEELRNAGIPTVADVCDIRDAQAVQAFVRRVESELGAVDVLVNNAGIIQVGPLESMTLSDYGDSLATHLYGPLHTIAAVLPQMRRRRFGRIVNIASIGGEIAAPHLAAYCVGKFALVGLSRGLRHDLLKQGILVTTVCPGLMRTGSARNALFKGQHRQEHAWFSISAALPGLTVSSESAAEQIVEACSRGRAELSISLPSRIAIRLVKLFPEISAEVQGVVARMLPAMGGIGHSAAPGHESTSIFSPSAATILGDRAALKNNEL
jgi:NAD(P)-dependent dehydrogenase (short-subunit alcohol dehydrogenase family)